jgi:hypothetical protein
MKGLAGFIAFLHSPTSRQACRNCLMSRFLVMAGSESMNRRTGSRRSSVHICVDQLASLVARARHQVPVAEKALLDGRVTHELLKSSWG